MGPVRADGASGRRQNRLEAAGWHAVMDGLAGATSVTSLNGLDDLGGLPDTALTAALREVMSDTAAPVSAGFSSSLRR